VGGYALLDSPVIPFLEKVGYIPGKQYLWMDRYARRREKQYSHQKRSGAGAFCGLPCVTAVSLEAQIRGKQEV
jgi:hypothetical protein